MFSVIAGRSGCIRLRRTVFSRAVRLGMTAATVAAASGAPSWVAVAKAAAPSQFTQSFPVTFTDTTTCGFPIVTSLQVTLVGRVYFDRQGNPVSATVENSNIGTDTGNGVTLSENDHWVDFFDLASGTDKQAGLEFQIRGGGVVVRDAGYIVFAPDGSISVAHGPHPVIEGDPAAIAAYCAGFS